MILWHDDTLAYEDEMLDRLKCFVKENTNKQGSKYYSNYNVDSEQLNNIPVLGDYLIDFYNENIKIMMKDLGIFGQWIYDIEYWTQMYYEGSTSHVSHSHFGTGAQVSWVHVIDAPEDQDCFHFIDSKCNKIYPKNQRSDTLFAFPSWAVHGVDSLKVNYDRIIVAGNVIFKTQL